VAGFIGSPAMNFMEVTLEGSGDSATLQAQDVSIPLPAMFRDAIGPTTGRKLLMGVRPEHLNLSSTGTGTGSITTTADVVEYLGNEELIHAQVAGDDMVALISSDHRVKTGDALTLTVTPDKLHLFDLETSASLARTD
jgi:multiple sugar transport system ATP-binding protein